MIQFHLKVPINLEQEIKLKANSNFKIITAARMISRPSYCLFVLEASEEEVTFLMLKYGKENVWLR